MVIERTRQTIEKIKERPHDERKAIAFSVASGITAVLLIGWGFAFFRDLPDAVSAEEPVVAQQLERQQAAANAATASSTGALIRLQNESAAAAAASGYWDLSVDEDGYQYVPSPSTR